MRRAPQRILVIGLSNVGDAVLMSPVIQQLSTRHPSARLTLLVGERARLIYSADPRVQTLWGMDEFAGVWGKVRLAIAVWRARPDLLIDLRQTVLPFVWRPWRILRYVWPVPRSIVHMRDRHLWKLLVQERGLLAAVWRKQALPIDPALPSPMPMWIAAREADDVDRLAARWGLDAAKPLVVLCPGARSHIKRWYVDRFAKLADRLIEEQGVEVLFTGEPDEAPIVHETMGLMRHRAHSAAGLTTLQQLGALMLRARLVITNDSATLHVACAAGASVVALFGPTDSRKYGPTGPRDRVIRRQLFCAPCERALCRFSHECMRFIPVDEVYEAARALLSEDTPAVGREDRA